MVESTFATWNPMMDRERPSIRPCAPVPKPSSGRSECSPPSPRARVTSASPDIAALTGLSVSTAHRLLGALVDAGAVAQERGHRALPPRIVAGGRWGRRAEASARVRPHAPGVATRSLERTGESVNLGTRIGDEVLIVLHVALQPPPALRPARGQPGPRPRVGDGQGVAGGGTRPRRRRRRPRR